MNHPRVRSLTLGLNHDIMPVLTDDLRQRILAYCRAIRASRRDAAGAAPGARRAALLCRSTEFTKSAICWISSGAGPDTMSFYGSSARGIALGKTRCGFAAASLPAPGGEELLDHLCERLHVRPADDG